jgi:hypothetical protein
MVIGGSPLITEHRILARDPSSMLRGNVNGSITGGPVLHLHKRKEETSKTPRHFLLQMLERMVQ